MARKPRLCISGIPYHVIQRGNNKEPIFFSEDDYAYFLEIIREAKGKHPCLIYGYCLMTNHFHLLAEPKEIGNLSLFMKFLGAKYVRYINKTYNRCGTLWQGRFKCSLIEGELYFLSCLHYIEMNPLRAGIATLPETYRWSSYRIRAFGEKSIIIDLDPWYNDLGNDSCKRQAGYRNFFHKLMPDQTWKMIRDMTAKNAIVGSNKFKEKIENVLNRKIIFRQPGRPKKDGDEK